MRHYQLGYVRKNPAKVDEAKELWLTFQWHAYRRVAVLAKRPFCTFFLIFLVPCQFTDPMPGIGVTMLPHLS